MSGECQRAHTSTEPSVDKENLISLGADTFIHRDDWRIIEAKEKDTAFLLGVIRQFFPEGLQGHFLAKDPLDGVKKKVCPLKIQAIEDGRTLPTLWSVHRRFCGQGKLSGPWCWHRCPQR
ncbi:uncharacterized protein LOC122503863 [Leptopilina heterotoma]|uniref:uncharacterized protein LOC122503863 n=1 Tax=Leptopilina heterotoma TaxID=63436 RepID=UPI001CA7F8C3|nr:uncharacterized protein LOC122503863 [Leptopilina heterotoma]